MRAPISNIYRCGCHGEVECPRHSGGLLRTCAEIVVLTAFITALLIWAPVIAGATS